MPPPLNLSPENGEAEGFVLPVPCPPPSQRVNPRPDVVGQQLLGNGAVGNADDFVNQVNRLPDSQAELHFHELKRRSNEATESDAPKGCVGAGETDQTIDGTTPGETRNFFFTRSEYIQMCWIPPGEFMMGSPVGAPRRVADEDPHLVKLSNGFWMSKCPVTQGQWFALMGTRPSTFGQQGKMRSLLTGGAGDQWVALPVESVSWMNICGDNQRSGGFLGKANFSAPTGWRFDLPSEGEWEYACRAGTATDFNNGGGLSRFAIWSSNLSKLGWCCDNSYDKTHPVARKIPNSWGLQDMHGNVWEWCSDYYAEYPKVRAIDPSGPLIGVGRVNRGGSWASNPKQCRSAFRSWDKQEHGSRRLGFRLVLRAELLKGKSP